MIQAPFHLFQANPFKHTIKFYSDSSIQQMIAHVSSSMLPHPWFLIIELIEDHVQCEGYCNWWLQNSPMCLNSTWSACLRPCELLHFAISQMSLVLTRLIPRLVPYVEGRQLIGLAFVSPCLTRSWLSMTLVHSWVTKTGMMRMSCWFL